jgi:hypothetical protein
MYLQIPEVNRLAEPPAGKPYKPPVSDGGRFITENEADKILTILEGPSRYQNYLAPILKEARAKLPRKFLRIVTSAQEVPAHLRNRFVKVGDKVVGGTIDRPNGTIYLLPPPGRTSDTRLEFALHEAIHLVAHPFTNLVDEDTFKSKYGNSCIHLNDVGSFQRKYCFGFGEGATQAITEHIMADQGIRQTEDERPYKEFTPVVVKLISIFSADRFARAYLWGEIKEFTDAMEFRWGPNWLSVARFAATGDTKRTLRYIDQLELEWIKRRSPKGDYPTRPSTRAYA